MFSNLGARNSRFIFLNCQSLDLPDLFLFSFSLDVSQNRFALVRQLVCTVMTHIRCDSNSFILSCLQASGPILLLIMLFELPEKFHFLIYFIIFKNIFP